MAGQRGEYKVGGVRSSEHPVWGLAETGCPVWSEDVSEIKTSGCCSASLTVQLSPLISDSGFLL